MPRIKHRTSSSGPKASERRTVAVTTGNLSASTNTEVTVALSGLVTTDVVTVNPTAALSANVGIAGARCSAAGVLAVTFNNPTTQAIASSTPTLRVNIVKYNG